jgi:hypothetical protein
MRDLLVQTPAPGFLAGSHPKVVRRHGQPAHTVPPRERPAQPQPQRGSSPRPPRPAPPRIFTQRDHPPDLMSFLYGFKAARRAARAAATERTPPLPLALPLRRRQRRSAGANVKRLSGPPLTDSSYRSSAAGCPCSRCGIVQGRSEPVKAVCDRRPTAAVELPGGGTREDDLD